MAITNSYTTPATRNRNMTTESNFSKGMWFSDTPLEEGYSRVLLNYALSDNGTSIRPRAGLGFIQDLTSITTNDPIIIHQCETALFAEYSGTDATMCKYLIYGRYNAAANGMVANSMHGVCLYNGNYIQSNSVTTPGSVGYIKCGTKPEKVHGLVLDAPAKGICAVLDGNTYVMTDQGLAVLKFKFNTTHTFFTIDVELITANNINAAKAVHNGYNMLLANPYTFSITTTSGTAVIMDGIVPYDSTGQNIKLNARIGDEIQFKLYYRYPNTDANKRYYAQWEIQDLDTGETRTLQRVRDSSIYTPGTAITFTTNQTTYKQFTLICKLYYKNEVDAVEFKSDALDAVNLKPIASMSTAYYYFTDTKGSQQNASTSNYDLKTATGFCTWQNRLVLWGVSGCKNTLWISEVNDPSYFPYPNNVEIFDDVIVGAVKLKTGLIVFTKSSVHQLTYGSDGVTLTNTIIQDKMFMEEGEACTIVPVQNMVFFKNDNYYYMIVPASRTSTSFGELTLAPVSKPITELLDDMINKFNDITYYGSYDNKLYGFDCYLEGSCIRIVYKFLKYNGFIDLVLQYDTRSRIWTTLLYDSDRWMSVQFIRSVTADSVFAYPMQSANGTWTIRLLQANPTSANDNYYISRYTVTSNDNNIAYTYSSSRQAESPRRIDTGYRKLNDYNNLNKKWRQIQFEVNNHHGSISFGSYVMVDNIYRSPNNYDSEFEYNDGEITDVIYPSYAILDSDDYTEDLEARFDIADNDWTYEGNAESIIHKVKMNINGKGKYIRFILEEDNASEIYDINSMSYVYRIMTGR